MNYKKVYDLISKMPRYDWNKGDDRMIVPESLSVSAGVRRSSDTIHEIRPITKFDDGSIYEGEWDKNSNAIDGRGIKILLNGTRYDGTWL